jgi:hypothetical protein
MIRRLVSVGWVLTARFLSCLLALPPPPPPSGEGRRRRRGRLDFHGVVDIGLFHGHRGLTVALPPDHHGDLPGARRQKIQDVVEVNVLRRRVVRRGDGGCRARIVAVAVLPIPVADALLQLAALFVLGAVESRRRRGVVAVAVAVAVDSRGGLRVRMKGRISQGGLRQIRGRRDNGSLQICFGIGRRMVVVHR